MREGGRGILSSVRRFKILAFFKALTCWEEPGRTPGPGRRRPGSSQLLIGECAVVTIPESRKDGVIVFIYTFYRYYVSYYGNKHYLTAVRTSLKVAAFFFEINIKQTYFLP